MSPHERLDTTKTWGCWGQANARARASRYYTETELTRLKKIDHLKQMGLSLEEIGEVIPLYCEDPTGLRGKRRILEILTAQLQEMDEKIESLQQFRAEMLVNIERVQEFINRNQAG